MKFTSNFLQQLGFTGPGVLVNETQARINIRTMQTKARKARAVFRPHFKTHQSAQVGRWFADEGVEAITVSSVSMAEYFAGHGWDDITIAFLLNPLQWPRIEKLARQLANRGGQLALTIDSPASAHFIAERPNTPLEVWIKVDAGYGRTGVHWQDDFQLKTIVEILGPNSRPLGLLTHSGNSYQAQSVEEIEGVWTITRQRLKTAALGLKEFGEFSLSVGDTPCCRLMEDLSGVQEIRPGNFVFFDLMQWKLGVCRPDELAMAAVCPVVGVYPERGTIVVHGGAVHLSREFLTGQDGQPVFGYAGIIECRNDGSITQQILENIPVKSLSQEHGTIAIDHGSHPLEIGDLVLVWPVHSCLTCDLADGFRTMTGTVLRKK